jgi:LemA protein
MFNDATKEYNTFIKLMPQALIAGITGFKDKAYFEADKEAEKAPKVNFE